MSIDGYVNMYGKEFGNNNPNDAPQNFTETMRLIASTRAAPTMFMQSELTGKLAVVKDLNRMTSFTDQGAALVCHMDMPADGVFFPRDAETEAGAVVIANADWPVITFCAAYADNEVMEWGLLNAHPHNIVPMTKGREFLNQPSIVEAFARYAREYYNHEDTYDLQLAFFIGCGAGSCCHSIGLRSDGNSRLSAIRDRFGMKLDDFPSLYRSHTDDFSAGVNTNWLAYQELVRVFSNHNLRPPVPQINVDINDTCTACLEQDGKRVLWSQTYDGGQRNLTVFSPFRS